MLALNIVFVLGLAHIIFHAKHGSLPPLEPLELMTHLATWGIRIFPSTPTNIEVSTHISTWSKGFLSASHQVCGLLVELDKLVLFHALKHNFFLFLTSFFIILVQDKLRSYGGIFLAIMARCILEKIKCITSISLSSHSSPSSKTR
jgi:hypothetical protein